MRSYSFKFSINYDKTAVAKVSLIPFYAGIGSAFLGFAVIAILQTFFPWLAI